MPGDMDPIRTPEQILDDQVRTGQQIRQLGVDPTVLPDGPPIDVDAILQQRHDAAEGALKFEPVARLGDGQTFVRSGEFVVRVSDLEETVRDGVHRELSGNRLFTRTGLTSEDQRYTGLQDLVWVYSSEGGTVPPPPGPNGEDAVDLALDFLASKGIVGERTMVTALHIVAKAADGPAPTVVTVGHYPETGADFASAPDVIDVAVIDNGIDLDLRQDGWLNEVKRHNGNVNVNVNDYNIDQLTVLGDPDLLDFAAGHGTFVAGIVRQVDPQARVVVYRVLDSDGLGSEADVAAAMIRAADAGAKVICLSLGMQAVDDSANKRCPALEAAVTQILSRVDPPAIVASAGNHGTQEKVYPAALEGVVSVAALVAGWEGDPEQTPGAGWSTRGDWVTCSAVGEGIVSTFVKGEEDPQFGGQDVYPEGGQADSWAVWSGTSFAAPQVAALISKTCRDDDESPTDAVTALFPTQGRPTDGYGTRVVQLPGTRPSP